jgi:histidinol dehydrogenase
MLKIFDVDSAKATILKRDPLSDEEYPQSLLEAVQKTFGPGMGPSGAVSKILESVKEEGDAALQHWSELLDGARLESFIIPSEELQFASEKLSFELSQALSKAVERIRTFHACQPLPDWRTEALGGELGQRISPIQSVGVYVPGGTAPLPSSLLMTVIPAQVAGVQEIVVCTPPNPHPSILAAADLCGLEVVYQVGGAQAIAAMAFGTESIPKVDKIVGAGNIFVTLAKQQVYGFVGLDGLAGPTETMVIADHSANPSWIASDLLAQAEHDPLASAILLTPDQGLAEAVQVQVAQQTEELSRADIINQSLSQRGGIVITPDLETAAELADDYAAEHLCLSVENPEVLIERINNAGGFFIGEHSFEVLGDYVAGPSHIMPTGGTARFASPLNVLDFVKINSIIALDPETSQALSTIAAEIATAESLTAHAAAATQRVGRDP